MKTDHPKSRHWVVCVYKTFSTTQSSFWLIFKVNMKLIFPPSVWDKVLCARDVYSQWRVVCFENSFVKTFPAELRCPVWMLGYLTHSQKAFLKAGVCFLSILSNAVFTGPSWSRSQTTAGEKFCQDSTTCFLLGLIKPNLEFMKHWVWQEVMSTFLLLRKNETVTERIQHLAVANKKGFWL